jgi:hypothetical protein
LGLSNSTARSSSITRVCRLFECQRIFSVKKSIYLKGEGNFCSPLCSGLYSWLSLCVSVCL